MTHTTIDKTTDNSANTAPSAIPSAHETHITPQMQQELEQLRDIHLPQPVSWYPMAIGWWVLIALVGAVILGWIYHKFSNSYRLNKDDVYLSSIKELQRLHIASYADNPKNNSLHIQDISKLAAELSALLKRVGRYHQLPIHVLTGQAWADYLQHDLLQPDLLQPDCLQQQDSKTDNQHDNKAHSRVHFSKEQAEFIAFAPYINISATQQHHILIQNIDWQDLDNTAHQWITEQFKMAHNKKLG